MFQKKAEGEDRYRVVDLVKKHCEERGGTYHTLSWRYRTLRSLFLHCRAELPKIQVNWHPNKDATRYQLTIDVLPVLLAGSGFRDRAVYLTLLQGLMDQERFAIFNMRGHELGVHIKEKGVEEPFRVDFLRGRKIRKQPFNTWLGKDALAAWKEYFDRVRGYPKQDEAAALDNRGEPLKKETFARIHLRRLMRLKIITGNGKKDARYGFNLHEFRDLARSILEKAKAEGLNETSAEFWMGHNVDPLGYNKLWKLDPKYNKDQYLIAEKHLNVTSTLTPGMSEKDQEKLWGLVLKLGRELQELKRDLLQQREAQQKEEREHTLNTVTVKEREGS
jgi:hypothetical protein